MAWPAPQRRVHGLGAGGHRHRRGRHGWRRRLHQPRLSGQGYPLGVFDPAVVGRRRHRRAVRGVFLQRTRGDVSALERRIQFFEPRLSSGLRIRGGLGLGDRWFRSTRGSGRDGFRGIRQIGASRRPSAGTCDWRRLAGVDRATYRCQALQHLSTDLDGVESRAGRRVPDRGICDWNAATYIIGEMRMPQQNLPRALLTGTLIVLVLYVALNAVFLHTTPIDKLSGQLDVARIAGSHIFGEIGGRVVGAMICIGLVSSISAMMWIGPRVMMTMGEDIPSLRVFARKSTRGAPAYAILFQLAVASVMLFTRSFEAVLDFIQFALLFCSFFTVLGVIKLRITQPDLPRPYRAWGYPITPAVFLLVTGFMMYYLLTERPLQSALGTLIMISGLLIYAVFRNRAVPGFPAASPSRE